MSLLLHPPSSSSYKSYFLKQKEAIFHQTCGLHSSCELLLGKLGKVHEGDMWRFFSLLKEHREIAWSVVVPQFFMAEFLKCVTLLIWIILYIMTFYNQVTAVYNGC